VPADALRPGVLELDALAPTPAVPRSAAPDVLRVIVWERWRALTSFDVALLGVELQGPAAEAVLARPADVAVARRRLTDDLAGRLGVGVQGPPILRISVVMCTHGRPDELIQALAALAQLQPAAHEVVVVDNAPSGAGCADLVAAHGFRYVREDAKGLDRARNAGIAAATGDVIAFTDDDCVPPPGWLAGLPAAFADPGVGGVTGPVLPYVLDTPARRRMEERVGMNRGFEPRLFDWQTISIAHGGAIGVGANMAFRRAVLVEAGLFAPELDAGTPTESGGDTYMMARVLAAGHRVLYTPELVNRHQHRADWPALRRAAFGYGVGISAAMTRLLVCDRELEAWRGWAWLVRQYLRARAQRRAGRAERADVQLAARYVRGALVGPLRWRRSVRAAPAAVGPSSPPDADQTGPRRRDGAVGEPAPLGDLTVVIVSDDAHPPAARALAALGEPPAVIVVPSGRSAAAARTEAARRATTPVVLFLAPDAVPTAVALSRHVARHAAAAAPLALGAPLVPREPARSFADGHAYLAATRAARLRRRAGAPTAALLDVAHLSVDRDAFLAVGGFDQEPGLGPALARRWPGEVAYDADAVIETGRTHDVRELLAGARVALVLRPLLAILERLRLRLAWTRLLRRGLATAAPSPPPVALDLLAEDRVTPPGRAPAPLALHAGTRPLAQVAPPDGVWGEDLAERAVAALADDDVLRIAAARGWLATTTELTAPADGVALRVRPGRTADARATAEAAVGLTIAGVAAVAGATLPDDLPLAPLRLEPEAVPSDPDFLAAAPATLARLGGEHATPAELLAAARRAGLRVARRDVHGVS
jgi:GT2 family glycosyltransferase